MKVEPGNILTLFLNFSNFEPQYSYRLYSYKKKECTGKIIQLLSMMWQKNLGQSCAAKCTDLVQGKLCNPLQHEVKFQEEDKNDSQTIFGASKDRFLRVGSVLLRY